MFEIRWITATLEPLTECGSEQSDEVVGGRLAYGERSGSTIQAVDGGVERVAIAAV